MDLGEFMSMWGLYGAIGIEMDAPTRRLVDSVGEAALAEAPAPVPTPQPEPKPAETEGWSPISPSSITKFRKAREIVVMLANAELPGKGMMIPDKQDRDEVGNIAALLKDVLDEVD